MYTDSLGLDLDKTVYALELGDHRVDPKWTITSVDRGR